jgi:hypothetical protein
MKMSQTVQGRGLTGVRVDPEDLGECLKIRILQLQILAAPFANPISAMPVVAQGIPPHVDGRVERVLREEPPKKFGHRANARFANRKQQLIIVDDLGDRTIQIRAVHGPEAFLELSATEPLEQKFRSLEQLLVVTDNSGCVKIDFDMSISVVLALRLRRYVAVENECDKLVKRETSDVDFLHRLCHATTIAASSVALNKRFGQPGRPSHVTISAHA